jgi:hypothetical protein
MAASDGSTRAIRWRESELKRGAAPRSIVSARSSERLRTVSVASPSPGTSRYASQRPSGARTSSWIRFQIA